MNMRLISCVLAASFLLTACGGGGQTGKPGALPPSSPSGGMTKASFKVHWPTKAASSKVRPHAISASAQSLSIAVNGGAPQVSNAPVGGGTTVVTIDAPVGTDSITIKAWDLPNAQGNVLDAATTSQLIVANTTNTINATLDGVCAAMLIVPTASQPFAEENASLVTLPNGSQTSILTAMRLVGTAPETFTVTPVDADGNTYLSSGGNPVIALTESGTTHHVSIAASTSGSTTTFTLTPIAAEPAGATTTLTATSSQCGTGTPFATNQVTLGVAGAIYVADTQSIFAFDQDGNSVAKVSLGYPVVGLAYDSTLNQLDAITSSGPTTGFGQLFQFSPTLTQTATGTLNVTIAKASKTVCNGLGQIGVTPASQLLITCPSTTPGTNAGHVRVVSVSSSGGVATTTDVTPASPKWTQGGTALYDPTGVIVEPNGNAIVADPQNTGYYFDASGNFLNNTYTSFTAYAYDPQLNEVFASYINSNIYLLAANGTYITNFGSNTESLLAYNPANQELYGLSSTGQTTIYSLSNIAGGTLPVVPSLGFSGLAAPTQFVATQ